MQAESDKDVKGLMAADGGYFSRSGQPAVRRAAGVAVERCSFGAVAMVLLVETVPALLPEPLLSERLLPGARLAESAVAGPLLAWRLAESRPGLAQLRGRLILRGILRQVKTLSGQGCQRHFAVRHYQGRGDACSDQSLSKFRQDVRQRRPCSLAGKEFDPDTARSDLRLHGDAAEAFRAHPQRHGVVASAAGGKRKEGPLQLVRQALRWRRGRSLADTGWLHRGDVGVRADLSHRGRRSCDRRGHPARREGCGSCCWQWGRGWCTL